MNIDKKLFHVEFLHREYPVQHMSYERETAFFQSIRSGDADRMHELYQPLDCEQMGRLSEDALRNLKYHLIISVALITRCCIEGGMEMEAAYNLSDIYIRSIDKCTNAAENMLKFSDHSCIEISNYLCFSSESHFIQVFRKHTGYTPKAYRNLFFRKR